MPASHAERAMPKKYSFIVENDEVVSIEVDGVAYASPDDIPDPDDRHRVEMMMPLSLGPAPPVTAGPPVEKIVAAAFFVVAAITLSIAVYSTIVIRAELAKEQSAPGRVVDLVGKRDSEGDELFYPTVEFTLPDGTVQTVEIPEGTRPAAHAEGDAVTVLYDPDDPTDARIDSFGSTILQWILPAITGTIGLAFTVVTLFLVAAFRRSRPEPNLSSQPDLPRT